MTFRLTLAALCAGFLWYSQDLVLNWDEGFHLVAASLIAAGKRPYVDFCFPQPPLHAWWNALWLVVTGGGWRGPQFVGALETCGALVLAAGFVYRRSPLAGYATALLIGLNPIVFTFGTKAQAYGACLLLAVGAFCATVSGRAGVGGLLAGLGASCSLLAAPAAPVLILWHAWRRCWRDAAVATGGVVAGLAPVLYSLLRAPSLTWFNLVQYHVSYRAAGWEDASSVNVEVLTSWTHSWQALLLLSFGSIGLWMLRRQSDLLLAAALAIALGIEAAIAVPTFKQYFILTIPFVAILAGFGFARIAPTAGLFPLAAILLLTLSNALASMRKDNFDWALMQTLATKVGEVTVPDAAVLADPPVYFALKRQPPSGMEFPASHDIEFPSSEAARVHIVSWAEVGRRLRAGEFAAVETCKGDEDEMVALELPKRFSQSATIGGCQVYWGLR